MTLKRCFHGIPVGGECTGTVHRYNLNSGRLLRDGIIQESNGRYIFRGFNALPSPSDAARDSNREG